jgi:magnesium chelatase family protein
MHIRSFVKNDLSLKPIDIEIALVPGLPQINIIGLPDKIIQESAKRVQTAILSQGYQMPKAKQVLINLNPREQRKSSLGIDLAMALGILAASGQRTDIEKNDVIYGGLHLNGEAFAPADIENLRGVKESVITGGPTRAYSFAVRILQNLQGEMYYSEPREEKQNWQRPKLAVEKVSPKIARLLKIIAVGEHSVILAGPPGGGKSTFVDLVSAMISEPREERMEESLKLARYFQQKLLWRPVISPHHSISAISMVGGGVPLRPGDIVRAHGGVLILEELLEFQPQVQSALREPLERGFINVSRGLQNKTFPARCLTLATTNLCKCGEFSPGSQSRCRCSSTQLRGYLEKFTGPFVDRFTALILTHDWKTQDSFGSEAVSTVDILNSCERVREFIRSSREQIIPNQFLSEVEIIATFEKETMLQFLPQFRSHRRRIALLRLARTLADLDLSEKIRLCHLNEAQDYSYDTFLRVRDLLA